MLNKTFAAIALAAFLVILAGFALAKDHDDHGHHYGQDKDHGPKPKDCDPVPSCPLPAPCPAVECGGGTVIVQPCPSTPPPTVLDCPSPTAAAFPVYRLCKERKDGTRKCKSNVRLIPLQ